MAAKAPTGRLRRLHPDVPPSPERHRLPHPRPQSHRELRDDPDALALALAEPRPRGRPVRDLARELFPQGLGNRRRYDEHEEPVEVGAGTVAQFEVGRLKPPDRATCSAIAVALGVSEAEVWTIARDERLRLADPDAFADLAQEHARSRLGSPLVEAEVELVNLLRVLDQERGEPEGTVARIVSAIVFPVALQAIETEGAPERLSSRLVWALARVGELPSRRLRRVLVAILRTVEAVVDASAVPGPSPEDDASGR